MLELTLVGLDGQGFQLTVPGSMTGLELRRHVRERLPSKPGAVLSVYREGEPWLK